MTDAATTLSAPQRPSMSRSVIACWMGYAVVVISGFILPRLIDAYQGSELLGIWDFGWLIVAYIEMLSIGVGAAVNRFVARERDADRPDALLRTFNSSMAILTVSAAAGVGLTLAVWAVRSALLPDASTAALDAGGWVVLFLGGSGALSLFASALNGFLSGYERFDILNLLRGIRDFGRLGTMALLLVAGHGVAELAAAVFAWEIIFVLGRVVACRRICCSLVVAPRYVDRRTVGELLVFGGNSVLHAVASGGYYQGTGILIGFFLGPVPLAIFARQRALLMHAMRFLKQYAQVFVPASSALHARGDERALQELLVKGTRYGLYAALPLSLLFVIMGSPLLRIWMGADFAAPAVLTVLTLGHVLGISQQSTYFVLMGMARHGAISRLQLVAATVCIALCIVALYVLDWGLVGVALSIALPMTLVDGFIAPLHACRLLGLPFGEYVARVLPGPVAVSIPFAAGLLVGHVSGGDSALITLLVGGGVGGLWLVLAYWRYVLPTGLKERLLARAGLKARLEPA